MTATYLDPAASIADRVDDLLDRMTLEEKAGQLFHTMVVIGPGGTLSGAIDELGIPAVDDMVLQRHMTHFNLVGAAPAVEMATWANRMQELGRRSRLDIPITISTDPRHAFTRNAGTASDAGSFSRWPEALGLAAIGDADLVERFADIARREYLAVGLRVALHPQLDVATEPRWARIITTFGEDADVVARLGAAYIRGFRGDHLGPHSVATMIKHFPGGAPLKDGEDSHFAAGREQVYPGGRFEYHLAPFRTALEAGASQVMPSYGMPVGLDVEEVACGFNHDLLTRLLREQLGFDGIICTDWGIINDVELFGDPLPARAWGVEHLAPPQRLAKAFDAGADQIGGEHCPDMLVDLVRAGTVAEARVDASVRRVLREKFALGLFDEREVDVAGAAHLVGNADFRAQGRDAQSRSVTVLTNRTVGATPVLPLVRGCRLHVDGVDRSIAERYATIVDQPDDADVSIVRVRTPFERRPGRFQARFPSGSLGWSDDDLAAMIKRMSAVPTVLDVMLERPAVLTGLVDQAAAIVATYGCTDEALLDALFGVVAPRGRLPVDLPRSMAAVAASRTDVPFDTADALFRCGHGLTI